jgi:hypothetical protein
MRWAMRKALLAITLLACLFLAAACEKSAVAAELSEPLFLPQPTLPSVLTENGDFDRFVLAEQIGVNIPVFMSTQGLKVTRIDAYTDEYTVLNNDVCSIKWYVNKLGRFSDETGGAEDPLLVFRTYLQNGKIASATRMDRFYAGAEITKHEDYILFEKQDLVLYYGADSVEGYAEEDYYFTLNGYNVLLSYVYRGSDADAAKDLINNYNASVRSAEVAIREVTEIDGFYVPANFTEAGSSNSVTGKPFGIFAGVSAGIVKEIPEESQDFSLSQTVAAKILYGKDGVSIFLESSTEQGKYLCVKAKNADAPNAIKFCEIVLKTTSLKNPST